MTNKYTQHAGQSVDVIRNHHRCGRKKSFSSAEDARDKGQDVYHCSHCGLWHRSASMIKLVAKVKAIGKKNRKRRKRR